AGSAVKALRAGDLVILPHGLGSWREAVVCPAASLVKVPEGISPEVAATLKINPATALRMLKDFVPLNTGDWLIQNGANSAVGRHVIQIAQSLRLQTLNIVRRQEAAEELRAMGAEVVLEDDPWLERLDELTGG